MVALRHMILVLFLWTCCDDLVVIRAQAKLPTDVVVSCLNSYFPLALHYRGQLFKTICLVAAPCHETGDSFAPLIGSEVRFLLLALRL